MLKKYHKQAEKHMRDPKLIRKLAKRSSELFKKNADKLDQVHDDLKTLIRLVKSWSKRRYTNVRSSTIFWAVAALLYFVNPFDLIPDFILSIGFLDDMTMIAFVVSSIRKELEDFRKWESSEED